MHNLYNNWLVSLNTTKISTTIITDYYDDFSTIIIDYNDQN